MVSIKIVKMYVARRYGQEFYYCLFDEIPEITYEKIGSSYIGTAIDEDGNIIFSKHLGYERWGDAFAGRELTIKMKDGTTEKIKHHWFDWGHYKKHGEFVSIGGGTLKSLQNCYVYCSYNIKKQTFEKMLDDYYAREKEYEYYEIEKWCKLQYKWHDVIIDGTKYPYMVDYKGDFVNKYSKEPICGMRHNKCKMKKVNGKYKSFQLCIFKMAYKDGDNLVKIERKMLDVLRESLPDYTNEEIIKNCKLNV